MFLIQLFSKGARMRFVLLVAIVLAQTVQQPPPHPDPYPKGQFCTPRGIIADPSSQSVAIRLHEQGWSLVW